MNIDNCIYVLFNICLSYLFKNMIKKIYLIRHLEVEKSTDIVYGRKSGCNLSLNEIYQAKILNNNLYNKFDKVYIISSPLERTYQTGNLIHKKYLVNIL